MESWIIFKKNIKACNTAENHEATGSNRMFLGRKSRRKAALKPDLG